jgi:hypothetical protein
LVMIILELPRRAFSCTGCNSNQLEASWRRNLFLLLHLCGRFPTRHNWRTVVAHRTHGPHDFPKPIGATDDFIPRFRGRSRHYPAFASFEPEVGQLRACRLLLKAKELPLTPRRKRQRRQQRRRGGCVGAGAAGAGPALSWCGCASGTGPEGQTVREHQPIYRLGSSSLRSPLELDHWALQANLPGMRNAANPVSR